MGTQKKKKTSRAGVGVPKVQREFNSAVMNDLKSLDLSVQILSRRIKIMMAYDVMLSFVLAALVVWLLNYA